MTTTRNTSKFLATLALAGIALVFSAGAASAQVDAPTAPPPAAPAPDVPPPAAPEIDAPEIDAPEIDAPEIDGGMPEMDAPEMDAPEIDGGMPEMDAPEMDGPEIDGGMPEMDAPEMDGPVIEEPVIEELVFEELVFEAPVEVAPAVIFEAPPAVMVHAPPPPVLDEEATLALLADITQIFSKEAVPVERIDKLSGGIVDVAAETVGVVEAVAAETVEELVFVAPVEVAPAVAVVEAPPAVLPSGVDLSDMEVPVMRTHVYTEMPTVQRTYTYTTDADEVSFPKGNLIAMTTASWQNLEQCEATEEGACVQHTLPINIDTDFYGTREFSVTETVNFKATSDWLSCDVAEAVCVSTEQVFTVVGTATAPVTEEDTTKAATDVVVVEEAPTVVEDTTKAATDVVVVEEAPAVVVEIPVVPEEVNDVTVDDEVPAVVIRRGARGEDVALLQTLLNNAGYALTTDGVFGRQTALALRQYQTTAGITVDAIAGSQTWTSLLSEI